MSEPWRLAESLVRLRAEVRAVYPGTTFWTIGDEAHVVSDHRPNAASVVCAGDILPNAGLDLGDFTRHLVRNPHPALKYVIYDRRIWSKARASEGWRRYGGSNPHTGHAHVSVGVGPDGRSTGPYDDTSPWGIANVGHGSAPGGSSGGTPSQNGGDDVIGLREGDSGERVKGLQATLRYAGYSPGEVDGDYGPKTSAAVLRMRKAQGSNVTTGESFGGWAYAQLMRALEQANSGDQIAAAVAEYLREHPPRDGEDGKTPTRVTIELTGDVVATE